MFHSIFNPRISKNRLIKTYNLLVKVISVQKNKVFYKLLLKYHLIDKYQKEF
jgi:hypothetical protein